MSDPYEEILGGDITLRFPPGARHELVLSRLIAAIQSSLADSSVARLLEPRTQIRVNHSTALRPDLALVTAANNKLWLAVEVVSSDDHQADTVTKKQIYEDIKVPRLWMVDPRYDNVEIYHATDYGLKLMGILAGREVLEEKLLPQFRLVVAELFAPP
ncbi:MAG: Uma2 family endonuclease [Pedosphaera sp.]|nr:Uma2 family endonuclease [Pedosphaera sp.]